MADAARAAILPHFRAPGLSADNKLAEGFDPVTVADRAAEVAMRDLRSWEDGPFLPEMSRKEAAVKKSTQ